ncbi:NADH-quinone oxidoreductase subunit C [soil metagenome]
MPLWVSAVKVYMTEKLFEYVDALKAGNKEWVTEVTDAFGEVTIVVPRRYIADACRFLKDDHGFDLLADLTGADRGPEEDPRFEVNYHLFSTKHYSRLRLKALLSEDDAKIETVAGIWKTANWHERETFDMFGVVFEGHPDLRRILMPSDFDGFALRKDFPLRGYEPYSLN